MRTNNKPFRFSLPICVMAILIMGGLFLFLISRMTSIQCLLLLGAGGLVLFGLSENRKHRQ